MTMTEFEMSEAQLATLLAAMRPTPYMVFGGMVPRSPQENANAAWKLLGNEMGFQHMTVTPSRKGDRFFTAVSKEKTA